MSEQEKVFCGSAKVISTQYGDLTKLSFHKDDIQKLFDNLDNGWVNCVVKEKQNKVDGKPTHYIEVDKWKPDTTKSNSATKQSASVEADTDLPF